MLIVKLFELRCVLHTRPAKGVQGCEAGRAGNDSNDTWLSHLFFGSSQVDEALFSLTLDHELRIYNTLREEKISYRKREMERL